MTILTATVTQVPIGSVFVEGLMDENGAFYVGVPQVAGQFELAKTHESREVKALLGKGFQFAKLKTPLNPKAINAIPLAEFEKLLFELALKGNASAIAFSRMLIGLSLEQLFSDAFGIKFEKEDRQRWLKERFHHQKHFHPHLTRWLKHDASDDSSLVNWGWEVNEFKRACNLPLTCVDTWEYDLLSILNRAESCYNSLRLAGLSHLTSSPS